MCKSLEAFTRLFVSMAVQSCKYRGRFSVILKYIHIRKHRRYFVPTSCATRLGILAVEYIFLTLVFVRGGFAMTPWGHANMLQYILFATRSLLFAVYFCRLSKYVDALLNLSCMSPWFFFGSLKNHSEPL